MLQQIIRGTGREWDCWDFIADLYGMRMWRHLCVFVALYPMHCIVFFVCNQSPVLFHPSLQSTHSYPPTTTNKWSLTTLTDEPVQHAVFINQRCDDIGGCLTTNCFYRSTCSPTIPILVENVVFMNEWMNESINRIHDLHSWSLVLVLVGTEKRDFLALSQTLLFFLKSSLPSVGPIGSSLHYFI